jgi:phosphoribosylformimino-5-aminoimidazole carboxamide ribotide isomerase
LSEACAKFPGKVAVGIDARGGRVAVKGWAEDGGMEAKVLASRAADAGAAAIVYTDIDRDGALQGVNVAATHALARAVPVPVIASGGVASLEDIAALKALSAPPIAGVICGRALYDGRIDPARALALAGAEAA